MKITVIIPTFNSAKTIEAALDSVLRQTLRPTEILVVDDGSTDTTRSVLRRYDSEITLIGEEHKGVASARNVGCQRATGELVAFLDSDDLWHPNYLEVQSKRFAEYPDAKAFFTGHVDFAGPASCQWGAADSSLTAGETQLLSSVTFFKQYNQAAGPFASISYCCVPRDALLALGESPFRASGAEDTYLFFALALLGPVVYDPSQLVAYRMSESSLSANRLRVTGALVEAFQMLRERYEHCENPELAREFKIAFAAKRREYSKILMSAAQCENARKQAYLALTATSNAASTLRSLALLVLTLMPPRLQPTWPSVHRSMNGVSA